MNAFKTGDYSQETKDARSYAFSIVEQARKLLNQIEDIEVMGL